MEKEKKINAAHAYRRALGALAAVSVLPVLESCALHAGWHRVFGGNNVVLGSYSWDMIPLLSGAAALCFVQFHRRGLFRLRFRGRVLAGNLILLAGMFLTLGYYSRLVQALGAAGAALWLVAGSALCLFSSPCFLVFPDRFLPWLRTHATRVVFAGIGTAALVLAPILQDYCWHFFSGLTGILAYLLIKLTGMPITLHLSPYIRLENSLFAADVKRLCSGLEGVSYFLFLYSLLRVLEGFRFRPWLEIGLGALGVLSVLALNGVRLAVLFVVAVYMRKWISSRVGYAFFVDAFHSNLGWFLYLGGLLLLFHVLFKLRPRAVADDGGVL